MQISSLDQLVGQEIGAYRVERRLGRGQLNAVYLAYHSRQNSPVALMTFILPETLTFEARQHFLLRFRKETAKLVALQHPHILPVYDYGEYAGHPYLVTPYMTNGSLADILKHRGRFHHVDVLDILQQVVAGLVYAHGKGVFHGALKPSNIVLNNQQRMLVAGFGLTQIIQMRDIEQDERPYAHLFNIAGTLLIPAEYVAPEVVQGQSGDARTDIYSLGVILFELLSGKPSFMGTNPLKVAMKHVQQPVPSLHTYCPDIPLALAAVVNQALDRDPTRRFQRVDELLEAFAQVSAALPENSTSTARHAKLQNTPAAGSGFGKWQLLPPIITEKITAIKPTSQKTNNSEVGNGRQGHKREGLVGSGRQGQAQPLQDGRASLVSTSSQEALFDLWTLSPQESLPTRRSGSAQWNATRHSRPFDRGKIRSNVRVSRRRAVALLVAGGVVIAGTAVTINLAGNAGNQQAQTNVANLAKNAAINFANPADGKASVLVHLADGNFAAYDRACTHKGVFVAYDPAMQLLVCPAHGATFDPANGGAVVQGVPQEPPLKPLPKVAVHINADGTIAAG